MKISAAVTALTLAALGCAAPAASAPAASAAHTEGPTRSAATERTDASLSMSVPDIRARVRKADATPMSARDRRCRDLVRSAMPTWWGPSGHTVVCTPGATQGYDFWFDGVAVLRVNSTLAPEQWVQSVEWATTQVKTTERLPLSSAPSMCRRAISQFRTLARKAGNYRVRCVPTITWKVPDTTVKDLSVLGYIRYDKRDIAIVETRDVGSMAYITAHELGHAVSFLPKAATLRTEVTRHARRTSFTSAPYVGMPAEVWAESFARYWTKQQKTPSIQKNRLSVGEVDALLRKHGLPRR